MVEVLVTLTILGVIASVVIPTIISKQSEKITIIKVKKTYAALSSIYNFNITLFGSFNSIVANGGFFNNMTDNLKGKIVNCGTTMNKNGPYKNLLGNRDSGKNYLNNAYFKCFILEDGVYIAFSGSKTNPGNNGKIYIDINGPKKPDRFGIDVFMFVFSSDDNAARIVNNCKYNSTDKNNGLSCGLWIVNKGNMDYLRRDISAEWNSNWSEK